VPNGKRFTLAGIGFGAQDETSLQFLTWTINVGPNPLTGYRNKEAVIGTLSMLSHPLTVIQSSQPVTIVGASRAVAGTHLGAAIVYNFYCRVHGWFYAEAEGAR
jgi:hypothetical protein